MAIDLTRELPRSPFAELRGYPWLPRLIDKARAFYAGTLGDYSPFPCYGDRIFLDFFRLDAKRLGELIAGGADEASIVAWVEAHAKRDRQQFRLAMRQAPSNPVLKLLIWHLKRRLRERLGERARLVDWPAVDALAKVVAVEEGYDFPRAA